MRRAAAAVGIVCAGAVAWASATGAPEGPLEMGAFLQSRWPSRASWSPDGRYVSYLSTDWQTQDLFVVGTSRPAPVNLTNGGTFLGGRAWSGTSAFGSWAPDARRIAYEANGRLIAVAVPEGGPEPLARTPAGATDPAFSPDGQRLAYRFGGNLFVAGLADSRLDRQLTQDGRVVGRALWSPDGQWIAIQTGAPPTTAVSSPAYLAPLLSYRWTRRDATTDVIAVTVDGTVTRSIANDDGSDETAHAWTPDSVHVLVERRSRTLRERSLMVARVSDASSRTIYRQADTRHLATSDQVAAFSRDGRSLLFTSDEDGWNHLYVADRDGDGFRPPRQLTRGAFEVSYPSWAQDARRIAYVSSERGAEQRHVYQVAVESGAVSQLTSVPGVTSVAARSPADDRLLVVHSSPSALPDLWLLDPVTAPTPLQLTESMTPALRARPWAVPRIVSFAGTGGLTIRGQLFEPPDLVPGRRYPVVLRVHEASEMNQEVFLGPGVQKNSVGWYGWHQRLAGLGYVVLSIDYRGSFGYGRAFRTADYLALGTDAIDDVVRAAAFVRTLPYVDATRLAICGLSAGGRMVLTAMAKHPDLFRAGIALAGIYDYQLEGGPWDTRNPWNLARLGSPRDHPEAYREASPRTYVDRLAAPLLIMHGTADVNVPIVHSLQLVEDLVRLGKPFDFEVYPGEVHFFASRSTWVDAFGKMETFLERHIGSGPGARP